MRSIQYAKYGTLSAIVFLVILATGCATTRAPGTRPDEMSHAGHLKAAKEFNRDAARHARRYDPNATETREHISITLPDVEVVHIVNPTAKHLDHARRRREIARQHAAAARVLKQYEQKYCKGVPVAKRRAHPLPGNVSRVELIPSGVRLHLKPGLAVRNILGSIACHAAHARLNGFAGEKDCPLHLRGVTYRIAKRGSAIELVARSKRRITELQRRARAHRKR